MTMTAEVVKSISFPMSRSKVHALSEETEDTLGRLQKELSAVASSMTTTLTSRLDMRGPSAPKRLSRQEEALLKLEFSHVRRLLVFEASVVVKRATQEIEETLKRQKVLEKKAVFCNSEIERKLRVLVAADMQTFCDSFAAQIDALMTRVLAEIFPRESGLLSIFSFLSTGKEKKATLRCFVECIVQEIDKAMQSVISMHVDKLRGDLGSTLASLSHTKSVNAAKKALVTLRSSLERSKLDAVLLMRSMCRKYKNLQSADADEERVRKYLKDAIRLSDLQLRRDAFQAVDAASVAVQKVLKEKMAPVAAAEPGAVLGLEAMPSRVKICLQMGVEDLQGSLKRLVESMDKMVDKDVHSSKGREGLPKKLLAALSGVDPWTEMTSALHKLLSVLSEAHVVIGEGELISTALSV